MGLFSRRKNESSMLAIFDGRTVKYITKRVELPDGSVNHDIVGKGGRIVLLGDKINIFAGEKDIFSGNEATTECNMLLSGDGATVKGINQYTGKTEMYTVYFTYYRK